MAKQAPSIVRCRAALIAWQVGFALVILPAANAQELPQAPPPLTDPLVQPASAGELRLDAIEKQLQELQSAEKKRQTKAAQTPTFKMGGQLQIDYLFIGQDAANRASVGDAEDTFDFRRARLVAGGETFDVVTYAIGFDFALSGRPSFLDNWVAVRDLPVVGNVRAGHYFEPFSLERYTINRYNTFMERSLVDAFAPARNLGIMLHDTVGDEQLGTWAVGLFRSDSDVFGDSFSDNGGWAVTSRATWLPLYDSASDGRALLHLGAAYTYRCAEDREVRFASFPEARAGSPASSGIPPFVDTGLIAALSDQRLGTEIALIYGPLYLQAEYVSTWVDREADPGLLFHGAYAFASFFLTGEHRTYDKTRGTFDRVYPFENFFRVRTDEGIEGGLGAWEIAARWSFIDLTDDNVQGGLLHDVTLGLNWHLNPFTRVKWEYIQAHLNRAPVGDSMAHIFGTRFEIDF